MKNNRLAEYSYSKITKIIKDIECINEYVEQINMRSFRTQEAIKQIASALGITLTLESVPNPCEVIGYDEQIVSVDTTGYGASSTLDSKIDNLASILNAAFDASGAIVSESYSSHTHDYKDKTITYAVDADGNRQDVVADTTRTTLSPKTTV